MLDPFPVIRIKGRLTPTGARVTLLTVTAPPHVRVTVLCSGASCPVGHLARAAAVTHLHTFERALRYGTRLTITVTRPGYIGKSTVIIVQRGRKPTRRDLCLPPGRTRAVACPAS
jgi:hypothetical protein